MKLILLVVILSIFSGLITSKLRISRANRKFYDEQGRTRIFHGVNVVYKLPPYIPSLDKFDPNLSLSREDVEYMKKFGFNLVRFGVIWEAIETSPNVFNSTLLDTMDSLINLLGENGIYTIVDAHQDVFSRALCGEGVPHFYIKDLDYSKDCQSTYFKQFLHLLTVCKGIKEYNYRKDEQGRPLIEDCLKNNFMWYHTSPDLTSLYEKLFNNANGLLDKFISFWKVLATKFKSNQYVIGYDLWNEPFPADFYNNLKQLIPGNADNDYLLPFYRKIDKGIREIDDQYIMMFEPTPFPDVLPFFGGIVTGGFREAPLAPEFNDRQVLNMHTYCCQISASACATGEPTLEISGTCRKHHFNKLKFLEDFGKKHNMSTILTEFGACKNSEACYNEISSVADAADKYLTSWTYWMYKPFNDFTTSCTENAEGVFKNDGTTQEYKVKALTRTYIQAYQGDPIKVKFDKETKVFKALFMPNLAINSSSELYFNKELNYKNGYKFFLNSTQNQEVDESIENTLKFKLSGNDSHQLYNNKAVLAILSPKIEVNVSLLSNSRFISNEELTYSENIEDVFSFVITDIENEIQAKNSIQIENLRGNGYLIEKSSYYTGKETIQMNFNKEKIFSFSEETHYSIPKILLKIRVGNVYYEIEIKNMLKNHIVIKIK